MSKPVVTLAVLLALGSVALARPEHKQSLRRYYGDSLAKSLFACATCHDVAAGADEKQLADEAPPHNAFGKRLSELGESLAAQSKPADLITRLKTIADEDADGDGAVNELELLTGHAPGNAQDVLPRAELAAAQATREQFQRQYRWEPFRTVQRPPVPAVKNAAWASNPVDAFLAAEHEARGLKPRPEASRHVLLRRVYLDLIGLPPTRDELQAFLSDPTADAYRRVVDRLLANPRYGERWGRHWMDVWRYSDWAGWGQQVRDSQPHIWHWRDWIVESLNQDLPYDQMLVQMLAADELLPEDPSALRATGFLVRNFKLLSREQWMQDTVDHTFLAFQGLTVKCARCHDHLYDPIAQKEYYQLRAIFEPHQVRIDQVPGVLDIKQNGLPRVYDADLSAATYLFHRGDERTPDKEHPIAPGVPAALEGPRFQVTPVSLPSAAHSPEKRTFVVDETLAAGEKQVVAARGAREAARNKLDEAATALVAADPANGTMLRAARQAFTKATQEFELAAVDAPLAEARQASLAATVVVERLEDAGSKDRDAAGWEKAATAATVAQRRLAVLEAQRAIIASDQAVEAARLAREAAEKKSADKKDDAALKQAADKSVTALDAAAKKLAEAHKQLATADATAKLPPTSEYTKRAIKAYPTSSSGRRLALARWLADPRNALTARVAVNHIWLRHFGQPLVDTVFDFGQNGRVPTHPALVDWLAAELMQPATAEGPAWSMKHLHRLLVTSNAYRMQSTSDDGNRARDPDNRYVWQMPSRRMEAEIVRDSVLYVAGQLDLTQGGADIDCNAGLTSKRRSLYFRHAAEKQMTLLKLFDAAAVTECYERKESIVPQQALAMANSELTIVQSRLLARKLSESASSDRSEFIRAAFEQVLARPATDEELLECVAFLAEQQQLLRANRDKLSVVAASPADGSKPSADPALRARENLVHVLLNHHDFVTIR